MTIAQLAIWLLGINIWTFAMFGRDKRLAMDGRRRIAESTLLMLALIGGSPGALIGRSHFRHKTRKEPFRTLLVLIFLAQIGGLSFWLLSGFDANSASGLGTA